LRRQGACRVCSSGVSKHSPPAARHALLMDGRCRSSRKPRRWRESLTTSLPKTEIPAGNIRSVPRRPRLQPMFNSGSHRHDKNGRAQYSSELIRVASRPRAFNVTTRGGGGRHLIPAGVPGGCGKDWNPSCACVTRLARRARVASKSLTKRRLDALSNAWIPGSQLRARRLKAQASAALK
jgi:hypothetical protein